MHEIDLENWNRYKQYKWFSTFRNSTFGINIELDVTDLIKYVKENNKSFFVTFLYVLMKGLNSREEMRIRYVNGKVVMYDDIDPAYTVMTKAGTFENVISKNNDNFEEFYEEVKRDVDKAKNLEKVDDKYNNEEYNQYYITCVPWIDFSGLTHPIPDDKASQVVPRVCFGKYHLLGDRYKMMLNITVSHEFVDGYPLSQVFINIQNMLDDLDNVLNYNRVK
jgi:chloramphenicol O-acetyltransferase type A